MTNPMRESHELSFKLLENKSLYRGFFQLNLHTYTAELFEEGWSEPFNREIFERGHAVAVLLLDIERETVVLVEQFRPGAVATQDNPWLLEPVAGIIEEGEKPETVAERETVEEAGCEVKRLHKICEYLVSPGGSTERIWLYAGQVDSENIPEFGGLDHEHEDIKVHKIGVKSVFEMLERGEFNNGVTLIAIQWLKLNWHKMAEIWP